MGRFRVKLGEAEIEYEGEDSSEKYPEALTWLKESPVSVAPAKKVVKDEKSDDEASKAGGRRSAVLSPKIDELIVEKWFSTHKKIPEIVTELKSRGVPGVTGKGVRAACMRRVGSKKLATIEDSGERVFWSV